MPKISKKKLKEINLVSFIREIITELDPDSTVPHWIDIPPETWSEGEKQIFDIAAAVEEKVKGAIIKILEK